MFNLSNILFILIQNLLIIVPVLLTVAIFTLFERKVIGYIQRRKGPNIVGFSGILQPFADALKLIMKEPISPLNSNYYLFFFAPILTLLLSLVSWAIVPFDYGVVIVNLNIGILFILGISSLSVYGLILAGWASNSKYAFFGALRSAAQMISYEVSISILLITVLIAAGSLNLTQIVLSQESMWYFIPFFPVFILFFISGLAETNRHPFDLPEAESELVSGYNVEYSSVAFAFFFIGEYSNILFMSTLTSLCFFGGWLSPCFFIPNSILWLIIKIIFFVFLFIVIRAMLPRYRYDQLMSLGWKVFLPLSLGFFVFYLGIFFGLEWLP